MFLLSTDSIPQLQVDQVESALQDSKIDTSTLQYVKKLKSLNAALVKYRGHDKSSAMAERVEALMEGKMNMVDVGIDAMITEITRLEKYVFH